TRVASGHLGDVLEQALRRREPASVDRSFGAAGRRGFGVDPDLWDALPKRSSDLIRVTAPIDRMLLTTLGQRAVNAVGSADRALSALQRLSLEIMAVALRDTTQVHANDRLLVFPSKEWRPPTLMQMSANVQNVEASRPISDDADLSLPVLLKSARE